jgi:hypothetical protein
MVSRLDEQSWAGISRLGGCPRRRGGLGGTARGTLGGHDVLVSSRCMDHRKSQDTVEQHPSAAGVTTIEPEDELVR